MHVIDPAIHNELLIVQDNENKDAKSIIHPVLTSDSHKWAMPSIDVAEPRNSSETEQ